jgi:SAM-dependent methyltransferase
MTQALLTRSHSVTEGVANMERALLARDEAPLEALVAEEIERFGIHGPFLDVGAGTGIWVAIVERAGELACGVDVLPEVLLAGRERYGLRSLLIGEATRLPFRSATFRWIQLREVIEHVDREQGRMLLAELRRLLAPGGTLRLTTPNRLKYAVPRRRLHRGVGGLLGRPDDHAHIHEYWPWELRARVLEAGFSITSFRFRAPNRYIPVPLLSAGIDLLARARGTSSGGADT